jgi:hypothetical protein
MTIVAVLYQRPEFRATLEPTFYVMATSWFGIDPIEEVSVLDDITGVPSKWQSRQPDDFTELFVDVKHFDIEQSTEKVQKGDLCFEPASRAEDRVMPLMMGILDCVDDD